MAASTKSRTGDAGTRLDITTYRDYRILLKDLFEQRKSAKKNFSYQYCAKKLGTSRSYLKLVIDRKHQIKLDKVSSITRLFRLTEFETQYFTFLYLMNTTEDPGLNRYFDLALGVLRARQEIRGDVRESIIGAVNMGNDADTVATIVGAITGTRSGIAAVPEEWTSLVERANDLDFRNLAQLLAGRPTN